MKSDLEKQILKLRPSPLPDDLIERLKTEPQMERQTAEQNHLHLVPECHNKKNNSWRWLAVAGVSIAACLCMIFLIKEETEPSVTGIQQQTSSSSAELEYLTLVQENKTLLSVKTLATEEFDGQIWELAEEKWLDNTVATCSATPALVSSKVIRHEITFQPVKFH